MVSLGALAGLLFARWGVSFLVSLLAGPGGGILLIPQFDLRVLAFTAGISVLTALLFSGARWEDFTARISALPGVTSAAVGTMSPLTGRDRGTLIRISGGGPRREEDRGIHVNQVTAGYFDTFGIRLLSGRFQRAAPAASIQSSLCAASEARSRRWRHRGPGIAAFAPGAADRLHTPNHIQERRAGQISRSCA